jgi:putative hemolysin
VTGLLLLLAGLFVVLSAILSAAESAAYSLGESRVRTIVEEGFRGADRLSAVRRELPSVRAAALLASSALNLAAVGLLTADAARRWDGRAIALVVPAAVLGVLVASEAVPRLIASRQSIRLALIASPFLLLLTRWLRPFLAPFARIEEFLHRRNGDEERSAEQRELRELAELGRREGLVEEEEHRLVERAFRMDELSAWDIMTPRVDVFAWPDSLTLEEIVPQLQSVPYSRVPVYEGSIDDITGILYVREAYDAYVRGHPKLPLSQLSREPFFVPGSLPLPKLLRDFQARRIHMGIVADEFGGTDGLVTLEDVIEELVGEIEDETDIAGESIHRVSKNEAEVQGGVELREVNYAFNVSLPHLDHRSLNGFILEELGRVPEKGEKMSLPGLAIEILDATETQVLRARLTRTQPAPADES